MHGPQISNRRGSGSSHEDHEKLRRRTEYGNEVRNFGSIFENSVSNAVGEGRSDPATAAI